MSIGHFYHLQKGEDTAQKSTKKHSVKLCWSPHHATEPINLDIIDYMHLISEDCTLVSKYVNKPLESFSL